jgi:hypothetical protein
LEFLAGIAGKRGVISNQAVLSRSEGLSPALPWELCFPARFRALLGNRGFGIRPPCHGKKFKLTRYRNFRNEIEHERKGKIY